MRRRIAVLVTLFAFLAIPQLAHATLIHNQDNKDHTVRLEQGKGSVSATVKAKRAVSFRCSSFPCTVRLGDSTLTVRSASEDVLIKSGKLVRKPKHVAKK